MLEFYIQDDGIRLHAKLDMPENMPAEGGKCPLVILIHGFTGQMESAISRFYAGMKPAKAAKYALILSSASPGVTGGIEAQYKCMLAMFGAEDAGIIAVNGEDNKSEAALTKAEALGKGL